MRTTSLNESSVIAATLLLMIYAFAVSAATPVMSAVQSNKKLSNTGSVTAIGVGVYWDQGAANSVTSIDWGMLEPGSNKSVVVYIRNEGNSAASLGLQTSNWNPSNASDYLSLSWDYGDQLINAEEILQVEFTLSISPSIAGIEAFSFDITIIAST